jgi:biopolymer transport protein ExbD
MPREQMEQKFRTMAASASQPSLKVIPDKRVRYEAVAQVLAAAQRSGVKGLSVAPIF